MASGIAVGALGPVFLNSRMGRIDIPCLRLSVTKDAAFSCESLITSSMLTTYANLNAFLFGMRIFSWTIPIAICVGVFALAD